ncbi:galactokinase [Anaerobutyricum soehngenii]|uniref:galactokinase n=1 Tax=Anaerobutyricum soehngenii TaxID=105843 RepID=UPI003D7B01F2
MKTTELKAGFQSGKYAELLKDIYIDESVLEYQKERYVKAIESFEELFGVKDVEIYSAPGRSEIGGNHTDHQCGRVLAASINLDAIAIVAKKESGIVLKSEGYPMINVSLADLLPTKEEEGTSAGLIRGVAARLKEEGYEIGGFEAYVTSDVLNGAGMSSSAAFEVLIGNILSGLYNEGKISPVLIAQAGQYAENVFFGKPCGLMDQMASSVGNLIFIDFADVKNPVIKKVNVNFEDFNHSLCIVDTKGSHADLTDEYAAIPEEMKRVAAYFGKEILKQVDKNEFYTNIPEIRKVAGDRAVLRAMHWFEETDRVIDQVNALEEENFEEFKKLIKSSGDSSFKYLQNVYSVKNLSRQEMAVGLALSDVILKGKGVSRVHGGGFAGTIQAFVPNDIVDIYKKNMEDIFGKDACHVLKIRKYGGMKVL